MLKADTTAFAKGMGDAKKLAFDSANEIAESFKHVGESLTKLKWDNAQQVAASFKMISGLAIGAGVAVGAALAAMTKEGVEAAAKVYDLSQKVGVSSEVLTSFSFAAKQSGLEQDSFAGAVEKLSKAMLNQNASFKQLGIQTTDATGKLRPVQDVLLDVAAKFSKMQDGAFKTATAMQLFGKSGAEMLPMLNEGRAGLEAMVEQAKSLGVVIDSETAAAADKLDDSVTALMAAVKGMSLSMAKEMLPALNTVSQAILSNAPEWVDRFKTFAKEVAALGSAFLTAFSAVQTFFDGLGSGLKMYASVVTNVIRGDWRGAYEAAKQGVQEQKDIWKEYIAGVGKLWSGGDSPGASTPKRTGSAPSIIPPREAVVQYANTLDELTKKTEQLAQQAVKAFDTDPLSRLSDELQKHILKIEAFKALNPTITWADLNRQLAQMKTSLREVNELQEANMRNAQAMAGNKALDSFVAGLPGANTPNVSGKTQAQAEELRLQTDVNERNRQGLDIYRQTRTAQEYFAEEQRKLNTLLANGNIDAETYARALARIKAETGSVRDGIRGFIIDLKNTLPTAAHQAYQAMATVFRGMHDSIRTFTRDFLMGTKSIGQTFKELGINIVASMIDAFAEIVANWIMTHVVMKAITAIFGDGLTSDTNKQIEENMRASASSAALAAANTLALTSALYPPPVPEALAATAYGMGMMFTGLASAAGGMEVDRDQIVKVHENEKILPARVSKGFDAIINSFNMPRTIGPRMAMAGGGMMGPITLHVNGAGDPNAVAEKVMGKLQPFLKRLGKDKGYKI